MSESYEIVLGDAPLTLREVEAIASGRAHVSLSPAARALVAVGRAIVDRIVAERIPAYGVTTGVGSQKDYGVDPAGIARYNDLLITGHATIAPGPNASRETVRAALAIQLALFATGRSGVRPELVDSLLARLQADDLPGARLGSSIGASDIVAMSQLAVPLIGKDGVTQGGAGPSPIGGLRAKEAVSLLNSNSLTLAEGVLALAELRGLLNAATTAAALSLEGLRGNPNAWSEAVDHARGQPGQSRVGAALRQLLAGSRLWQAGEPRFLQDPLSFRCVPQMHGAAEAAYDFASEIFSHELSAACDNPLIDLASGQFISHGNMETTACALALDTLRLALAKVIEAAGQRIHKIQWPGFTGLPTSLARDVGAIGGVQFLNLAHIATACVGAVCQAANPAMLNYRGQVCDGVEDVGGNAPLAVAETVRALEPAWNVVAIEAICAVWAIDRRAVPFEALGEGLRDLIARIRPLLPIGTEGQKVFDVGTVVALMKDGPLTPTLSP